jgi:hypothetical protein
MSPNLRGRWAAVGPLIGRSTKRADRRRDVDSGRRAMRVHHFGVAIVAVTIAALPTASGFARTTDALNNPVRITDKGCVIGYKSVGHQYTTVVFGVFNNGTVSHGFDIGGPYRTRLIKPGQEETLVTYFHPGAWRYACVARHSTVARGVFTIRP